MFHQLSASELADILFTIEAAEDGRQWLLRLRSLNELRVKSNEIEDKREKSEESVIPRQQQLSA